MKLNRHEMNALCEYADGRLAAGAPWHVIAEELEAYTQGEDAKLTEADLDSLQEWHRTWKRRGAFVDRQRRNGDCRGGAGGVAEVEVDWQAADAGAVKLAVQTEERVPTLAERAEALRVLMYLRKGLLKARWKWVDFKWVRVPEGGVWEECRGPGRTVRADGSEAEWISEAVIIRGADGRVLEVYEEARRKQLRPEGWRGKNWRTLVLKRRELDGEIIDVRDVSAQLATLLHVCLGGAQSPFRNNQHLATLLGVSREAMRVRKQKIIQHAGIRTAEGMAPNRAAGGRAAQRKKAEGLKS